MYIHVACGDWYHGKNSKEIQYRGLGREERERAGTWEGRKKKGERGEERREGKREREREREREGERGRERESEREREREGGREGRANEEAEEKGMQAPCAHC